MFDKTARFYDAVYSFKDYGEEAQRVLQLIDERAPDARTLLDVACGTGLHLLHFRERFACEGIDLDENLLTIARERNPGMPLHSGNMLDFDLGRTFDAVTCLFSAIGYVVTYENLVRAFRRMAAHLNPGGVVIVEPWLFPDVFKPGLPHMVTVDEPDLKVARLSTTTRDGDVSYVDFDYLIGEPGRRVRHEQERHATGLFSRERYLEAIGEAGLTGEFAGDGLKADRGLFIATR